jgi:hypothetical protein
VVETVLEEVDDLLVDDVDYGGALVEEAPHVIAEGLALFLLRDGNGDPIPDSPRGIHPLGDGDGMNIIPAGTQIGKF